LKSLRYSETNSSWRMLSGLAVVARGGVLAMGQPYSAGEPKQRTIRLERGRAGVNVTTALWKGLRNPWRSPESRGSAVNILVSAPAGHGAAWRRAAADALAGHRSEVAFLDDSWGIRQKCPRTPGLFERDRRKVLAGVPTSKNAVWVFPKSFMGDYKHVGRRLAQSTRANIVATPKTNGKERDRADVRGHDLRRSAASLMASGGVPRFVISRILIIRRRRTSRASTIGTAMTPKSERRWSSGIGSWRPF